MNELAIFANDIAMLDNEYRMSLKSITDRFKVRHNNAMSVVENLAKDAAFGELLKISSSYINNFGATLPLETYALNKRQSIAVAARLNTEFLMLVIDRWQELEDAEAQRQKEQLALAQQEAHEAQAKLQNTVFQINGSVTHNRCGMTDWRHRFEPLRCVYEGVTDRWGNRYTPKDAVAALGNYVDEAQQLISIALDLQPALVFALKQSGITIEVAYKVANDLRRYARKQQKEAVEGGAV